MSRLLRRKSRPRPATISPGTYPADVRIMWSWLSCVMTTAYGDADWDSRWKSVNDARLPVNAVRRKEAAR